MITDHAGHEGHKITNRYGGPWCDTCAGPIEHAPEWCHECWGDGVKHRWSNAYNGRGKPYRCGACKGTGERKPAVCVDCGDPATIYTSQIHPLTSFHCQPCYQNGITQ
jgi:DnaJ-class molecular chaperone